MSYDYSRFLIVSDLDGTFFGKNHSLVQKNLDAIRDFQDQGGTFTYATGRDIRILEHIFPNAGEIVNAPAVLSCGSYLYDFKTEQVFDEHVMDHDEAICTVKDVLSHFSDTSVRIGTFQGYVTPEATENMRSYLMGFPYFLEGDIEKYRNLHWHKAVFVSPPETSPKVFEYVKKMDLRSLSVSTSASYLVEIFPKDAGKGRSVLKLKEIVGPDKIMICVGDQNNDLDMLEAADAAACPDNAIEDVKDQCAIRLCENNEGCIADLIRRLPTIFE